MCTILVLAAVLSAVKGVPLLEEHNIYNVQEEQHDLHRNDIQDGHNKHTSTSNLDKELDAPSYHDNFDTKKHYYLFKITEYYNFLPRYLSDKDKSKEDRYLQFEIDDFDDAIHPEEFKHAEYKISDNKTVKKRDVNSASLKNDDEGKRTSETNNINGHNFGATLAENIDVIQFVKRDTNDKKIVVKRDLGDFSSGNVLSADSDDPMNNNYRYIAYVPFFKVRKYYIHRKRLDLGL